MQPDEEIDIGHASRKDIKLNKRSSGLFQKSTDTPIIPRPSMIHRSRNEGYIPRHLLLPAGIEVREADGTGSRIITRGHEK
jgi:hypothetical protein